MNSSELGFDQLYDRLHFVDHVWQNQFVLIILYIWFRSNLVGGKILWVWNWLRWLDLWTKLLLDHLICKIGLMKWSFWSPFQVMLRPINSLVWNLTWAPTSILQDLKPFMMNSVAIGSLFFFFLKDYTMKDCNSMLYHYFRCPVNGEK